jgi:hypothetical protein
MYSPIQVRVCSAGQMEVGHVTLLSPLCYNINGRAILHLLNPANRNNNSGRCHKSTFDYSGGDGIIMNVIQI